MTGAVTADPTNAIFTFTPSSALALNTVYTATITTGAIDEYGIALASNFVWSFTTSAKPCAPPTVISVTPVLTAGVCPSTVVTATFSEAMNPATINATTFTLTGRALHPWQYRSSYLRWVNRDLHTIQRSRPEHALYRHDYHGGPGPLAMRWRVTSYGASQPAPPHVLRPPWFP